ncbi:hypothetical protein SKAU_G00360820 [Synaphobranchus kaupii]|uniref:Uncharacterized protein n=1 Tax=Synaphobranchus kaupii TaxID=118154 RepID=A0A9Q1EI99_SYNKA|nr:hypothetical protein SKAU_G00360820 [Synaphobranchus kaupii]
MLPKMPSFPPGKARPRSMTSLVRESTSHQRSLRQHTPNAAKLHKTQSLTQPRATRQSAEDSDDAPSTSGSPEPESVDRPEPEAALEQQEDDSAPATLICGDEQGEEATREQEAREREAPEQEARQRPRPAGRLRSGMLSLTINNEAGRVHCGLVKKCWSEMQMGSVDLPLFLTQTSAGTSHAPTLTLPVPLLSALVPAPSPLPQSLLRRRSPSEDGVDAPGAPLPGDRRGSPALTLDPSPKRRLAGLRLLLSFVFPSFRSFPIYLPPSSRRIPG